MKKVFFEEPLAEHTMEMNSTNRIKVFLIISLFFFPFLFEIWIGLVGVKKSEKEK